MWMFIAGASFGCVLGFLTFAILNSNSGSDCINCQGIIDRDAEILSIKRSRDLFRNNAEQSEAMVRSLRIKLGLKNHNEGKEFYRKLGVV